MGIVYRPDAGAHGINYVVPKSATGGVLAVIRQAMPARRLISGHVHERNDVWVYVLAGRVGARVGDEEAIALAGEFLLKPRGVPHAMWNPDDEPNALFEFLTPGEGEDFFRAITEPGADFADASARTGVRWFDDWTEELEARYGVKRA